MKYLLLFFVLQLTKVDKIVVKSANAQFCNPSDKTQDNCSTDQNCPNSYGCNIPVTDAVFSTSGKYIPKTTGTSNDEIKRFVEKLNDKIHLRFKIRSNRVVKFEIAYLDNGKERGIIYKRTLRRTDRKEVEYFSDQISSESTMHELINLFLNDPNLKNTREVVKSSFDQLSIKFEKVN